MSEPPQFRPLPVRTPVNSLRRRLYWPKRKPISRPPTPMSPAGTSVFGPMWRGGPRLKVRQERLTPPAPFPLRAEEAPPLPPPPRRGVGGVLQNRPEPRDLKIPGVTG